MMSIIKMNPFSIPEIISLVGGFLDLADLLSCIRVSKAFHNTLVKPIWKRVTVGSAYHTEPTFEAVQNHKKHIEKLEFYNIFPKEYRSMQGCDRLKYIGYYVRFSQDSSALSNLSNLIRAHSSTITELRFYYSEIQGLWRTLLECTHLEVLSICEIQIHKDEVDLFFQVCKKIRDLRMTSVSISQLPSNFLNDDMDEYILPNMKKLILHTVQIINPPHPHTSSSCLGMLTRRCPKLRSLDFCDYSWDTFETSQQRYVDFYRSVFLHHPYTLTNLSDLRLTGMKTKDEDMAALLRQMTALRQLIVQQCDFGPLSIRELLADEQEISDCGHLVRKRRDQRLCDTIEKMHFNINSTRADGIVQMVLSNCPRLKELHGPKITVTEIVDGAKWVSTGLTSLSILLEADVNQDTSEGMQKQRIAFRQLGKLTQLNSLILTGFPRSRKIRTLDFRLKSGLDELVNLKSLYRLSFEGDKHQRMHLEDETWIKNNWPNIRDFN
ncbi:hypothetical protein BCR41DRAFT_362556 [Lobosporangium transversale]|uniref:F-box domain-containing protein n=1 Tax=Lobosporangium transversale TaxID=64571 RepID=A0A1Y2G9C2_9FUNG|nr:hypothetical protein BCR41DRAFT_362556 [Lobosporangium transversale]ORZ04713.1 hypothetical protein BCR41DRAFT_362556 [Lobosporangium transversale]|eukprot:XP_021876710.1 hypothetical protein BCR41DRAFT_362556 [Lobosporangium transversale]